MPYKFNPFTGALDYTYSLSLEDISKLSQDQFVPYGALIITNFKGIKGQWSYRNDRYIYCIATDTWIDIPTEKVLDEKISNIFASFTAQYVPSYVPCCLVPNNSAPGLKGQWSFQVGHSSHKGYVKLCIATNTWVRFEVDTLF